MQLQVPKLRRQTFETAIIGDYREIPGICEGAKEDKSGWLAFLRHLVDRGLQGVELLISDACPTSCPSPAGSAASCISAATSSATCRRQRFGR